MFNPYAGIIMVFLIVQAWVTAHACDDGPTVREAEPVVKLGYVNDHDLQAMTGTIDASVHGTTQSVLRIKTFYEEGCLVYTIGYPEQIIYIKTPYDQMPCYASVIKAHEMGHVTINIQSVHYFKDAIEKALQNADNPEQILYNFARKIQKYQAKHHAIFDRNNTLLSALTGCQGGDHG